MATFIRFERGRDGVIGPTLGPYPFVQITCDLIHDEHGETIAEYVGGDWALCIETPHPDTIFSNAIVYDAIEPPRGGRKIAAGQSDRKRMRSSCKSRQN